jgi:2,3,4,5-tetrahydropyridine-2-carboxylate N-succinyltransferase
MTDDELMRLEARVDELWAARDSLEGASEEAVTTVRAALGALDAGEVRVAEPRGEDPPIVHGWLQKAILLAFRLFRLEESESGPFVYADRLPLKRDFMAAGVRVVPGASARFGAFLGRGVVLMPSYVNVGAYVGAGTMVDTWATVGSGAQIGERVHLSGGVGIGGVLEPPQAAPVVIGDDAFVGSRAMITEGARVGSGAVIGAGLVLNPSIPVVDAESGEELSRGVVPGWCVAVPASRRRSYPGGDFYLPCALVVRRLPAGERHDKTTLAEVLRLHGVAM